MKNIGIIILLCFWSCSVQKKEDCASILKAKDKAILQDFEQLINKNKAGELSRDSLEQAIIVLKEREKALFQEVKTCDFHHLQDYNYWYRGRMKFPSPLDNKFH